MKIWPRLISLGIGIVFISLACKLPSTTIGEGRTLLPPEDAGDFFPRPTEGPYAEFLPVLRPSNQQVPTPTPDPERNLPPYRTSRETYTVKANDTLENIASRFAVTVQAIAQENNLVDVNMLSVGEQLLIPPPIPGQPAPDLKLIPDSELVNGPYNAKVDLAEYIMSKEGYLASYTQEVKGELLSGIEVIQLVSGNYSVNPRLLRAILEHQSGWLTQTAGTIREFSYPVGIRDEWREGLYYQLTWAANSLNRAYYLWRVNGLGYYTTADGILIPLVRLLQIVGLYGKVGGLIAVHCIFGIPIGLWNRWFQTSSSNLNFNSPLNQENAGFFREDHTADGMGGQPGLPSILPRQKRKLVASRMMNGLWRWQMG